MRNKLSALKDHFNRHRFAYGVTTGITLVGGLYVVKIVPEWNAFLKEQGVYDAYYETFESE